MFESITNTLVAPFNLVFGGVGRFFENVTNTLVGTVGGAIQGGVFATALSAFAKFFQPTIESALTSMGRDDWRQSFATHMQVENGDMLGFFAENFRLGAMVGGALGGASSVVQGVATGYVPVPTDQGSMAVNMATMHNAANTLGNAAGTAAVLAAAAWLYEQQTGENAITALQEYLPGAEAQAVTPAVPQRNAVLTGPQ